MTEKWRIEYVQVASIEEADINANVMSESDFEQLTKNIKKSGFSSVITCYRKDDGKYVIISGHHRFRACVKNNYSEVPVIFADEADLTEDEKIALQLSHNSIHGEDNKGILKRMFEQISSLEFKEFAHINSAEIETISFDGESIMPQIEHFSLSLVLFREDKETLEELFELTEEQRASSDIVILASQSECEDELFSVNKAIMDKYKIKSTNIAFVKILELAKKQLEYEALDSNNKG